ncbi:MAG: MBL fold metallo-hydrolase [bacterium]
METDARGAEAPALPIRTLRLSSPPNSFMDHVVLILVGEGPGILIDAGYAEGADETLAWLKEAAADGPGLLLLTHHHHDHFGGAEAVLARTGAPARAHPREIALMAEKRPGVEVLPIEGGERVRMGGVELEAVLTPGHSPGHLAFWWAERRVLFGGDNVLGEITTWVGPPHGNLRDFLASVERVRDLAPEVIYPGHGPPLRNPGERIGEILRHRARREEQVLEALAEGLDTPERIAGRIYAGMEERVVAMGATMVVSHLEKLIEEGRVRAGEGKYLLTV